MMKTLSLVLMLVLSLKTGLLQAQESLTWLDKLNLLSFGPRKSVLTENGRIDLGKLNPDEYWHIKGRALFVPGEWVEPADLMSRLSELQSGSHGATLVELNNSNIRKSTLGPNTINFGSYIVCFDQVAAAKYSLWPLASFHPYQIYKVESGAYNLIGQYGNLNRDPAANQEMYNNNPRIYGFEANANFCLLTHVSAPISAHMRGPNLASFFIGHEQTLMQYSRNTSTILGGIVGGLGVACLFYAFIFAMRPYDRSSFYLCMFALSSFMIGCLLLTSLGLGRIDYGRVFSILNVLGISFLGFFIVSKISSQLKDHTVRYLRLTITTLCLIGIFIQLPFVNRFWGLYGIVLQLFNLFLIGLGIRKGLRYRISGIGFFIMGAILATAFQLRVLRVILENLNEPYGYGIILANFSMTLALALVNAKEFAMTYRDSELLRQEQDRLLKEIKEKEQARTLFFQNTSHELRTPLNGMIGFMTLISQSKYGTIPAEALEQLHKCIRLAVSLKNQVNTILDLAKSKKGSLTLQNSALDLGELASEAEDLAAGLLLKRDDFSFSLSRQWSATEKQFIGDREKLRAIIRNLVGNAFKFCDPARANAVHVEIRRKDDRLFIEVRDTGIGIGAEDHGRIFEEFQQISGDVRRAYEGTGLGLAMVRDFVRLMGGTIHVESTVGVGSCFRVEIPQQTNIHLQHQPEISVAVPQHISVKSEQTKPSEGRTATARIMVIDDNELNCEVLKDLLESEGFGVRTMLDGREALKLMHREHPDLVLLDMMMPFFSGEDVIKAMQADTLLQDIPIILVTARASEDDRLFGLSLGADDYLAKPIHHEELLFRVRNILHRIEVQRKVTAAEEGHKLTQLGQLMREFSHELKNVFQMEAFRTEHIPPACEAILKRLPLNGDGWNQAAKAFSKQDFIPVSQTKVHHLVLSKEHKESKVLRSVRSLLAMVNMGEDHRLSLWEAFLALPQDQQLEVEHTLYIIRNFLLMQDQTTYVRDLVRNILDFARSDEGDPAGSTMKALERVMGLLHHRIQKSAIQVEVPTEDYLVNMNQGHLMQVLLNLFINACDAVETMEPAQRFIEVRVVAGEQTIDIICSNGGQPFTKEQAERMMLDEWSTKGSKGYGLGLAISSRLVQRCGGTLEATADRECPEFRIQCLRVSETEGRKIA